MFVVHQPGRGNCRASAGIPWRLTGGGGRVIPWLPLWSTAVLLLATFSRLVCSDSGNVVRPVTWLLRLALYRRPWVKLAVAGGLCCAAGSELAKI